MTKGCDTVTVGCDTVTEGYDTECGTGVLEEPVLRSRAAGRPWHMLPRPRVAPRPGSSLQHQLLSHSPEGR